MKRGGAWPFISEPRVYETDKLPHFAILHEISLFSFGIIFENSNYNTWQSSICSSFPLVILIY